MELVVGKDIVGKEIVLRLGYISVYCILCIGRQEAIPGRCAVKGRTSIRYCTANEGDSKHTLKLSKYLMRDYCDYGD